MQKYKPPTPSSSVPSLIYTACLLPTPRLSPILLFVSACTIMVQFPSSPLPPTSSASFHRLSSSLRSHSLRRPISVHPELHKNQPILHHRPQTPNQPRQIRHHILPIQRMEQYPRSIRDISHQAQHKEQEREAFAGFVAVVLDDLRNTCSVRLLVKGKGRIIGRTNPR